MEYKKINNSEFLLVQNDVIVDIATEMLKTISGGNVGMYDDALNDMLFNSILSRLVTSDFFANGNKIPNDMNFITIKTSVNGKSVKFSVGEVSSETVTKKLNGVIYD